MACTMPSTSPTVSITAATLNSGFNHASRGELNLAIVLNRRYTVIALRDWANYNLRYFSVIDDQPGGERWFVGRGCKNCHGLRYDPNYHSGMDWFTTFAIRPSWGRDHAPTPMRGSTSLPWKFEIVHDYSLGHNLFVTRDGLSKKLIAVGGQKGGKYYGNHGAGPGYSSSRELRDGLRIMTANNWNEVVSDEVWKHPRHDSSSYFIGREITSAADKRCCFDSVVSLVKHKGRWLVFTRVNLKFWGGRFVQVAKSRSDNVHGPYERSKVLDILGYPEQSDGNIYFGAIHLHPLDPDMLLGLFPVNLGIRGRSNADGDSFIGMALSCDGVHWSELVHVMKSVPRDGRTYDMPVNGMFVANGVVTFYVHRDVEHVAPTYATTSKIEELRFRRDRLEAFTQQVKSSAVCAHD